METTTYQLQTKMACGEWCDVPYGVYESYGEACTAATTFVMEYGYDAAGIRFRESDNDRKIFSISVGSC
jgi:YD repeat-containing protein